MDLDEGSPAVRFLIPRPGRQVLRALRPSAPLARGRRDPHLDPHPARKPPRRALLLDRQGGVPRGTDRTGVALQVDSLATL